MLYHYRRWSISRSTEDDVQYHLLGYRHRIKIDDASDCIMIRISAICWTVYVGDKFRLLSALIVQWLGHLVVAEKTWVRFPLGAHNDATDSIGSVTSGQ